MTKKIKTQVEVQGTKKLDSIKGVQLLSLNEMQEIEGGIAPIIPIGMAVLYLIGTTYGLSQGKRFNGMP